MKEFSGSSQVHRKFLLITEVERTKHAQFRSEWLVKKTQDKAAKIHQKFWTILSRRTWWNVFWFRLPENKHDRILLRRLT